MELFVACRYEVHRSERRVPGSVRPIVRTQIRTEGETTLREVLRLLAEMRPHDGEEGQGLAEYALILALIAIIAIAALIFLGGEISQILSTIGAAI